MNEKTAILNVRMLGDFSITYDGRQVSFGKNTTTKAMKLLQILIYYGEQGIAREKLLNALYVREELADAANNLRVTAHRLKKMIIDAGLPEYDYIVIKKGVYRDGMRRFLPLWMRENSRSFMKKRRTVQTQNRRKNCSSRSATCTAENSCRRSPVMSGCCWRVYSIRSCIAMH